MNPALEEDDEDNEEADYDSYDDDEVGPSLYNSFSRYDNFAHSYELELQEGDDIDEAAAIIAALHDYPTQKK